MTASAEMNTQSAAEQQKAVEAQARLQQYQKEVDDYNKASNATETLGSFLRKRIQETLKHKIKAAELDIVTNRGSLPDPAKHPQAIESFYDAQALVRQTTSPTAKMLFEQLFKSELTPTQQVGLIPLLIEFTDNKDVNFDPAGPMMTRLRDLAQYNPRAYQAVEQALQAAVTDANATQFSLASKADLINRIKEFSKAVHKALRDSDLTERSEKQSKLDVKLAEIYDRLKSRSGTTSVAINQDFKDIQAYLEWGKMRGAATVHPDETDQYNDPDVFEQHVKNLLRSINYSDAEITEMVQMGEELRAAFASQGEELQSQGRNPETNAFIQSLTLDRIKRLLLTKGQINPAGVEELTKEIDRFVFHVLQRVFDQPDKDFDSSFNALIQGIEVDAVVTHFYRLADLLTRPNNTNGLTQDSIRALRAALVEAAKRPTGLVDIGRLMHNIPFVLRGTTPDKWGGYIGSVSAGKYALLTQDVATNIGINIFPTVLQEVFLENGNRIPPEIFSELFYDDKKLGLNRYTSPFFERFKDRVKSVLDSHTPPIAYDDDKLNWITHAIYLTAISEEMDRVMAPTLGLEDWRYEPLHTKSQLHNPGVHMYTVGEAKRYISKNSAFMAMWLPATLMAQYKAAFPNGWIPTEIRKEGGEWRDTMEGTEEPEKFAANMRRLIKSNWIKGWGAINKLGMPSFYDEGGWRLEGLFQEYRDSHNGTNPGENWWAFYDWCIRGKGPGLVNGFFVAPAMAESLTKSFFLKSSAGKKVLANYPNVDLDRDLPDGTGKVGDKIFKAALNSNKPMLDIVRIDVDGNRQKAKITVQQYLVERTRGLRGLTMYIGMRKDPLSFIQSITQMHPELRQGEVKTVHLGKRRASEFYFGDIDVSKLTTEERQKRNQFRAYAMTYFGKDNLQHLQFIAQKYEAAYLRFVEPTKAQADSDKEAWQKVSKILTIAQSRARQSDANRDYMTQEDILGPNPGQEEYFVADLMLGEHGLITHFNPIGADVQKVFGNNAENLGQEDNFFTQYVQAHYEVKCLNLSPVFLDFDPNQMISKLIKAGPNAFARQIEQYGTMAQVQEVVLKPHSLMKQIAETADLKGIIEAITKHCKSLESLRSKEDMNRASFIILYQILNAFRMHDSTRIPILGFLNKYDLGYDRSLAYLEYQNLNRVEFTDDTCIALVNYFSNLTTNLAKEGMWSGPMLLWALGLTGDTVAAARANYIWYHVLPTTGILGLAAYLYFAYEKARKEEELQEQKRN